MRIVGGYAPAAEKIHYYSIILGGKIMKKILALLLVVVMVVAMTACGAKDAADDGIVIGICVVV